ncbi:MAG: GNAT family N-acetyltransferase [Lentisphaerae bacterium]|jgi:streptothricin acetyltransferase|nr:GNAT family N-acetyltransferase [Lentisphaerota bacterium]MBT4814492.1 GNAT family N-acetyltransferase [Lentisphaerota bacterium]MBT5605223.1 GNAT family N-acetyltransferase [Lentisphaerota bacterium]MBT7054325.1 GNAT family N-acetyltransferase [Lentisphaerota bacterium]MBT7844891.1 GNAT family N-acetyltransferase [Lentisphaerota bacterium]
MSLDIRTVDVSWLPTYAAIPICFEVRSVLCVLPVQGGLGGLRLQEVPVSAPFAKDYDAYDEDPVLHWVERFDTSQWQFLAASVEGVAVGGATVAYGSTDVNMLEGRSDLAVLWDLRVAPEHRRQGIGAALFDHAVAYALEKGCRQLKIETQNVNVAACRFYASRGCHLGAINQYAYSAHSQVSHETMLLWYLDLR